MQTQLYLTAARNAVSSATFLTGATLTDTQSLLPMYLRVRAVRHGTEPFLIVCARFEAGQWK